ncbi:MAG TPA: glycosyltransferase [Fervidobacterium sp.]|nr:glycosyltransferase [Fervidobacterium sp.]
MTKLITIIGHFGKGQVLLNGQTIKTKNLYETLIARYSNNNIGTVDTHKRLLFLCFSPFILLNVLHKSKNIIVLPAHNGVRTTIPLLVFLNKFFKRKIHYDVIGGWLPSLLEQNIRLLKTLSKLDYIYVETDTMLKRLNKLGLNNVQVLPNSKNISVCNIDYSNSYPRRLCMFSRINRLKGIEDAINAVNEINKRSGSKICTLDIYGKVDKGEEEWFEGLKDKMDASIKYCGFVDGNPTSVLKDYYLLLFPTHYYTEGIPGTIIDSYSAGVPVLASKWESFSDVIVENVTGFGFEFDNYNDFLEKLSDLCHNPSKVNGLREECQKKAMYYSNENMADILAKNIV